MNTVWTHGQARQTETFDSVNPATSEVIATFPVHGRAEVDAAVERAREAAAWWSGLGWKERQTRLLAWKSHLIRYVGRLAELVHNETGKPLADAQMEIFLAVVHIDWAARNARRVLGPRRVRSGIPAINLASSVEYPPLGVIGVIGPWNYPVFTPMGSIAYALAAGNAVVFKPSELTPATGGWLVSSFAEEVPEHPVLQLVTGAGGTGEALARSGVDKISFTGSTATGKAIIKSSADTVKRLTLELGGNDAGIVLPDADPKAIAEGLFWGAFINTGQTCAALKRLYVHDAIYDAVCEELTTVARAMPMGVGLDEANVLGPLQNRQQFDIVARLVEAARDSGARILLGGNPENDQPGNFYPTTLVADIANSNPLVAEEQFGPALPIIRYGTVDEAIAMANAVDVGLGASVWSSDPGEARKVASRLEAGTVWINKHGAVDPRIPFGGAKQSGYGLEFGVEGLKALGVPQVING